MLFPAGHDRILLGTHARSGWLLCPWICCLTGCGLAGTSWLGLSPAPPEGRLLNADTAFTAPEPAARRSDVLSPAAAQLRLTVLNVRVPKAAAHEAQAMWAHVREQVLDVETRDRLAQNGIRVGIGNVVWWDDIRHQMDAIEGVDVVHSDPMVVRPYFPLLLEMDREPREQTLFQVDGKRGLSGSTWPASRNLIRIDVWADSQREKATQVRVTPTVWQRFEGVRFERGGPDAWRIRPNERHAPLQAVSFAAGLQEGEFLVIAPGQHGNVVGLVGSAFLTGQDEDREYHCYVFIKPEVQRVDQHR